MTKHWLVRGVAFGVLLGLAGMGLRGLLRKPNPCVDSFHDSRAVPCLPSADAYKPTPYNERTLNVFLKGMLRFAVLHEIGHMVPLTYPADAPMIGNEEDVADRFAAFYMTLGNDDPDPTVRKAANAESVQVLLSAVNFWGGLYRDKQGNKGLPLQFGDEHPLDAQRAELLACLLYGSNPADYGHFADEWPMGPRRRQECVLKSEANRKAWSHVVSSHLQRGNQWSLNNPDSLGLRGATVEVSYPDIPGGLSGAMRLGLEPATQKARAAQVLEFAANVLQQFQAPAVVVDRDGLRSENRMTANDITQLLARPRHYDYHAVGDVCLDKNGQPSANAYWRQDDRTLFVCYELINGIERIGKSLLVEENLQKSRQ